MNYQTFSCSALLQAMLVLMLPLMAYSCGRYEFYMWGDLPEEVQVAAEKLNYNRKSWNNVGTNPIEKVTLEDLIEGIVVNVSENETITFDFGEDEVAALETLDVYDSQFPDSVICWNHFINHYIGYSWDDLKEDLNPFGDNLTEAVEILGWNQELWDSTSDVGDVPESECKDWFDLNPDEQWALQSLGWTGMKWMSYPLGKFLSKD